MLLYYTSIMQSTKICYNLCLIIQSDFIAIEVTTLSVGNLNGVITVSVSLKDKKVTVKYSSEKVDIKTIKETIEDLWNKFKNEAPSTNGASFLNK